VVAPKVSWTVPTGYDFVEELFEQPLSRVRPSKKATLMAMILRLVCENFMVSP